LEDTALAVEDVAEIARASDPALCGRVRDEAGVVREHAVEQLPPRRTAAHGSQCDRADDEG